MYDSRHQILRWIENIHLPVQAQAQAKKRCRSSSSSPSPPSSPNKRCRLLTPAMSSSSSEFRTPVKRALPDDLDGALDGVDQETPRAVPQLPASKKSRTSKTSSLSQSSMSGAGCSPTKTLAGLAISTNIITRDFEEIRHRASEVLGPALHKIYTSLPKGYQAKIFPESFKSELAEFDWFQEEQLPDTVYYQNTHDAIWESYLVKEIVRHSHLLFQEKGSEVAWNEWVHSRVLIAALCDSKVGYRNVSRAAISPRDLIAKIQGVDMQSLAKASKIIDYAMCIDVANDQRLRSLLQSCGAASVNATNYEGVCLRPIAVSIETKRPDTADMNKAVAQLAIWTTLQFEHVQQLLPNQTLPGVPMIIVLGCDWLLYFFIPRQEDGQREIYGPIDLGNTKTHFNTYKLLGSLRAVAAWAATEFQDWWDQTLSGERAG